MQDTIIIENGINKDLQFEDNNIVRELYGQHNENLKEIETLYGIRIHSRGGKLSLEGNNNEVESAYNFLKQIYSLMEKGYSLDPGDLELAARIVDENNIQLEDIFLDTVCVSTRKRIIAPKSLTQKLYIESIRKNDIVFGVGPAGTGKTYLAMAMAVSAFVNKEVNRIILTRPAVEAGEKLGFLPGDLSQKVDPYLRPLLDALYDMMDYEKASRLIDKNAIEVAPLAFMRGRTLNDAFVVLDEAQNTTPMQMKMFLTRLGFNSKAVITGDTTQIDLGKEEKSGLLEAESIMKKIEGISFVYFSKNDVVRHPLVRKIIEAYEQED
ncbi:MAG: phosphate starvation-inducible protein [Thermodesulfobacteriota bacterium]|nr:MAG: phosphate starvation-inducible protein [Thermodesulfobacteriota bacterium]